MPKVSIVLPVYNGEKYLSSAIESIINQSEVDWELIVVDDNSLDCSLQIAERYAEQDKRIRVVHNECNMKLPASLNKGFSLAKGNYFTWTSDDNLYKSKALKTMCDYLDMHSEIDLVYCDKDLIDSNGKTISCQPQPSPENMPFENTVGACFLYRKKVADKVGLYDETKFLVEDYDYWIRVYLAGNLSHITQSLYAYRIHESSLSSTRRAEIIKKNNELFMRYYNQYLTINTRVEKVWELYSRARKLGIEDRSIFAFSKEKPELLVSGLRLLFNNGVESIKRRL